jgi:hypothetical protein
VSVRINRKTKSFESESSEKLRPFSKEKTYHRSILLSGGFLDLSRSPAIISYGFDGRRRARMIC